VKPGDRLTTGQVIGNLGNTGNTDAPAPALPRDEHTGSVDGNGIPFIFKSFKLERPSRLVGR